MNPDDQPTHPSFLYRAQEYLEGSAVRVQWADEAVTRNLDSLEPEPLFEPRARYLSQKFVEDLCSARGMTDRLLEEIQRVIFEAHLISETDGASDFEELLSFRASRHRETREREEESLVEISERIATEIEKKNSVATFKKQIADKNKLIAGYTKDSRTLVVKESEKKVERLADLNAAATKVRSFLRYYFNQEQALLGLNDEVENMRDAKAPEMLRQSRERFVASRMNDEEWENFLLAYTGDVDDHLTNKLAECRREHKRWKGEQPAVNSDPEVSYLEPEAALEDQSLCVLEAEIARLTKLVSVDRQTQEKYTALTRLITKETTARDQLAEKATDAEGAVERIAALVVERTASYRKVFDAIISEHDVLTSLYEPLVSRLKETTGTLQKLSFTVNRKVDLKSWAEKGQSLVDLRFKSPVRGRGKLQERAEEILLAAWQVGTAEEVSAAMDAFRAATEQGLLQLAKEIEPSSYRAWARQYATWLYSTNHVTLEYSINYGGADIRKLSPGTRGIILLLLYLALDSNDDRPLIIDQPEENLDPQSIFDELVGLFVTAKSKRQVIMVTHNANLVVNTDADQIIIANAGPAPAGNLPPITYIAGGLESEAIRKLVCDILEGGEPAFKERARRLRVSLDR